MTEPNTNTDALINQGETILQQGISESGAMNPQWAPAYALACFTESIAMSLNAIEAMLTTGKMKVEFYQPPEPEPEPQT